MVLNNGVSRTEIPENFNHSLLDASESDQDDKGDSPKTTDDRTGQTPIDSDKKRKWG